MQNEALDINIELNDPNSGNLEAFNGWLDYFKKIFGSKWKGFVQEVGSPPEDGKISSRSY